jgi:ABC-type lipoprotein export system ATPase subunit
MITVNGVTKIFGAGTSEVRAVDNVDLEVQPGEFIIILGRSGSGKSTLLGMLAGLIRPTDGIIRIKGLDINTLNDNQIAELRSQEIGFVFQFSGLIPTVTSLENVLISTLFCPNGPGNRETALGLLKQVGVADRADAYPGTLSSGEMKRVAIARALINKPSILIADEPTGDLDIATESEIMALFRQLNSEGITIIMVTHNPDLIPCATRTYRMTQGRMVREPDSPLCQTLPGTRKEHKDQT